MLAAPLDAAQINYEGDFTPNNASNPVGDPYGPRYTTIVFANTGWASDGDVLTMTTFPVRGIWFGRFADVGDNANFSLGSNLAGNRVDARIALGASSDEWTPFYFYDTGGRGAAWYFDGGVAEYYFQHPVSGATITNTLPVYDRTQFHVYSAHVQGDVAAYYFDGQLVGSGKPLTGPVNSLLTGDSSGSTPTGTGTFKVDYLRLNTAAGVVSVPEPSTLVLGGVAGAAMLVMMKRVRRR
jgi:hypothetical protein